MNAKDYLTQLVFLECKIKENRERVTLLKEAAESRTSKLDPNKVQASGKKDKLGDTVSSYTVLESRIEEAEKQKQEILDTISLLKPYESTVIYQCYVNNKFLSEIAGEMKRSYSWVSKKHTNGLKRIQEILDEREKVGA